MEQTQTTGSNLRRRGHRPAARCPLAALARRRGWPVVVFVLDLDGLKQVNDRAGHHAGDAALRAVADEVGITIQNLSVLKTGKAKAIRFSTLERLCEVLQCQPGDILAWEPGESGAGTEGPEDMDE